MEYQAQLACPVRAVFARLAEPARLGDWLREVVAGPVTPPGRPEAPFPLTIHADVADTGAVGEITAYEPPWLVGYRRGPRPPPPRTTAVPRSTCTKPATGLR